MKTIVLSGINLFEGGPLSIYYDCLDSIIESHLYERARIIAFVYRKELFQRYDKYVKLIELPASRKNYLNRIYYEDVFFYRFSSRQHVDIWFSLHDMTPRVKADRIYTYCHNPSPFIKKDITKLKYSWKVYLFSYFYKYVYRWNIKAATAIIVQQDWMRQEFLRMYPIDQVIVARPNLEEKVFTDKSGENGVFTFIYAAYPRYFKNYEVILEACRLLEQKGTENFQVWLTIDGSENRYSRELKKKYAGVKTVQWLGLLPREELFHRYESANMMIFPSTVETWGLPISEFKGTGKGMLLANLPYAHESIGDYGKVSFFAPRDAVQLSQLMDNCVEHTIQFETNKANKVSEPYCKDWAELIQRIISS